MHTHILARSFSIVHIYVHKYLDSYYNYTVYTNCLPSGPRAGQLVFRHAATLCTLVANRLKVNLAKVQYLMGGGEGGGGGVVVGEECNKKLDQ